MTQFGRALGVDYGTKRVGVAVSDPLGIVATAVDLIEETDPGKAAKRVAAVAKDKNATTLVFGMPVNMDGSEHANAAKVRAFAEQCGRAAGLPVEFVDERLTTRQAERHLWEAGLAQKGRKARVDMVAATLLLQSWLDARRRPPASTVSDEPSGR
jgi:putative Holliday junction resolvase